MLSNNLYEASRQWASRPPDERYWTLKDLHEACLARHEASVESRLTLKDITFEAGADERALVIQEQQSVASPSHLAFDQVCRLVDAPAPWLRRQPAALVADQLNWAVRADDAPRDSMVMLWQKGAGGDSLVRAFTTTTYGRLWDSDLVSWLRRMTQDETNGWQRPPAYTDNKYPSGYYSSDRDLFVFMVNPARPLKGGPDNELNRGFFCWNTETQGGARQSFGFRAFTYDRVCGNHIVWGAEDIFKVFMAHVGQGMSLRAQRETERVLGAYLNSGAQQEEQAIAAAMQFNIGATKDKATEWLRARGFTKADAEAAWENAIQRGANPTTLWEAVGSLTRLSQTKGWAGERNEMDRKAGKLLEAVF